MTYLVRADTYIQQVCRAIFAQLKPRAVRAYRSSFTYSFTVRHHMPPLENEQFKVRLATIADHLSEHIPPGFKMSLGKISHGNDLEGFVVNVSMTIHLELENANGPTSPSPRRADRDD